MSKEDAFEKIADGITLKKSPEEEREDLIAKVVQLTNASIEVLGRGWHGLPVDADRFKRYTTKELMCYLQKEQFESALEKEFGWIREDHFGQTERGKHEHN